MKKISNQELNMLIENIWNGFLQQASSEDLFQSVISSNWDDNELLLTWILNHDEVDQAVVLAVYWMSGPRYLKQFKNRQAVLTEASWLLDRYDFITQLEQQYLNDFWKNQLIGYDPKMDQDDYNWVDEYAEFGVIQDIPEKMLTPLIGLNLPRSSAYEDGLPEPYLSQVWALFDDYEIDD